MAKNSLGLKTFDYCIIGSMVLIAIVVVCYGFYNKGRGKGICTQYAFTNCEKQLSDKLGVSKSIESICKSAAITECE
jgi:hypothetical protein